MSCCDVGVCAPGDGVDCAGGVDCTGFVDCAGSGLASKSQKDADAAISKRIRVRLRVWDSR